VSEAPDSSPSFSRARRRRVGAHLTVSLVALLAVVLMANYLASRHYWRLQWIRDARFELSGPTRRVLDTLTNELHVTLLFDREGALFPPVYGLLSEYAYACPKLKLEHVNYRKDPGRAQPLAERLQLGSGEADLVVFELGSRFKVVRASELSDYDVAGLFAGEKEVRRTSFKGEALFTGAIASLLDSERPRAYFLRGHGEHDPGSEEKLHGYLRFAGLLQQKGIETHGLELTGTNEVPGDCRLLVIAGPRSRVDAVELEKLDRYAQQGGRVLALLSFYQAQRGRTGIEDWVEGWGCRVGDNVVFDPARTVRGNDIVVSNYAAHPVTAPLRGRSLHLLLARSVVPRAGPGGAKAQTLFLTSVGGYTASSLVDGVPRATPDQDVRGALPLAVAAERGGIQGLGADRAAARLVAVGESLFLGNEMIASAANLEFASLAVNWLLDRPQDLAGLAARPLREYRFMLTEGAMAQVRWLLLLVLPGAVLTVGGIVWWRRRV